MSEGDPPDDRDDEERHDQGDPADAPDDEPPADDEPGDAPEDAPDEGPSQSDDPAEKRGHPPGIDPLDGPPGPFPSGDPDESSDHGAAPGPENPPDEESPDDETEADDGSGADPAETGSEEQSDDEHTGDESDDDGSQSGTESDDQESDDSGPEEDHDARPTGKEEREDVTISGGAAAPTPEDPEPVAQTGAPDDEEMPLADHIREMVHRLLRVIVVMAAVSAVVFFFADELINFLWYSFLPGNPTECVDAAAAAANNSTNASSSDAACPRIYHPLSLVLARLKVASLAGFIIALPVFVFETYLFMRPGLYPHERRYYIASVPTSLVLAGIGVLFAYLLVLPLIFTYFLGYSQPVAEVAFGLSETFGLILLMLGMFAAIFQIPLFLMLAIMMGVTTRRWLVARRLYFWFGFATFAFLFSPDPTGMAPFIVAITMVALFEGTLLLLRWTGR